MTALLFIGVLHCLAIWRCCEIFVSGWVEDCSLHQVRSATCVKGLILRNMAGREKDAGRLYENGYKQ